ncbi:MAG: hypothetical protein IV100_19510 [Myxococcales bacterium]|nr:hypothetical protein [Myxococcales bacterium]
MVKGLDLFRRRFAGRGRGFVLIGGAACHEWFARQALTFRATKDLDLVVIVEALDDDFVHAFRAFVDDGAYQTRERFDGTPELYRFSAPTQPGFPHTLELFSRKPEGLELRVGQTVVPVDATDAVNSLSAILLDDDYYGVLQENAVELDGLPVATTSVLVPLKARAWLDLTERQAGGERVDQRDIDKHRNDVFRLAAIVPGEPVTLPPKVRDDVQRFLDAFPADHPSWAAILSALSATFGRQLLRPVDLRSAVETHYRLKS